MNLPASGVVEGYRDWITGKIDLPLLKLANFISDTAMNTMRQYI